MSELGADVLKVEPLDGDVMRLAGPMRSPGMGHFFLTTNQNKRSLSIDLKSPEGFEILLDLVASYDILFYNIRPRSMTRLGLTWERVSAVNPALVYLGVFGFSQRGPYADRPAYDDLIQGMAGIPHLVDLMSGSPRYAPMVLADRLIGIQAVNAALAALLARERTGRGQRVDVPMFESLAALTLGEHMAGELFVPPIAPPGYQRSLASNRRPYETKNGHICVMVYNDRQWATFLKLIDRADLIKDDRFRCQSNRLVNINYVYGFLSDILKTNTSEYWMRVLVDADIPVAAMNSIEDILDDPHLKDIGFFEVIDHPSEGQMRRTAIASEWSDTAPAHRFPAPRLGEHSRDVLRETGMDDGQIEDLIRRKIVRSTAPVAEPREKQAAN
jgi:crotonobetainyl-CoA:carnitine CoA-transferase CaiB-like acyl-CoA transferase